MRSKLDTAKIRSLIEALPICKDGKRGVAALIEAITGEKIAPISGLKEGAVYSWAGDHYIATQVAPKKYKWIGFSGNRLTDIDAEYAESLPLQVDGTPLVYVAASVEEAIKRNLLFRE